MLDSIRCPEPAEEQGVLLSQAVRLQHCRGRVVGAALHALLHCCICSTVSASKGRQQPSAEPHQQLPVPRWLFQEAVASVWVRMCKAGRGKAIEGFQRNPLCPGAQLLLSICLTLKEPQLWHRSVYCCILGCTWKNAVRRMREGIIHFHV